MYRSRATILTSKSLRTLSKVRRQSHHLESLKFVTFSRNISTATQISEIDNYSELKGGNSSDFQQNPDGVFNYSSNNTGSLNKLSWKGQEWAYNQQLSRSTEGGGSYSGNSRRIEQNPCGVYPQKPRTEFREPKDTNRFQQNPHAENGNFSSGYVNVSSRNEFQQTVGRNGSLSSSSNDFASRKDYQSDVVHNISDSGYHGENSSNLLRSSRFEGGLEAQPSQNGVYGQYQQNLTGYYGGKSEMSQQNFSGSYTRNVGVPQQNPPNYDPGNVRNVQSENSETYPRNASGYNMERHTNSSGYSREMMGGYQQNLSGFNPSSAGHQASYQSQNGIVGHQEMRSSTPVEQSIDSADSSSKKGSVDELDDFCKDVKIKEAVEVLHLLEQQHVTVDLSRYIMLMDVCSEDKSLEDAKSIHEHLVRSHPHLDIKMYNKILEMYGKCGSINDAFLVFRKMPQRNLTSWDTMITWLGKNGLGEDAIELFGEFKKTGMKPDGQMFLGVFHACSVVGDIVEGMLHFESMSKDYDIVLSMEQYVGVVDMLGSTGYLDEAMEFIERMPIDPSIEVWETMMNLCRIHGNLELGDRCAEIVELLDPSRLDEQSKAGFLDVKASDIAKEKEKKKSAQSLLEARSKVHEYRAGDRSHPDHEKIYALLRGLKQLMKEDGYIPETKFVLHDVDQETKEDALMAHSERLAFAQGLMNSSARSPIRIIKNLRVCGDCHNALKIASKLVGREIIMRDAKRFHHLKDGLCSCRDYW
ncbi:pentatricopeptide repeat-containing protein At4g32450, mitochondrial-like [Solanum dulcamara]|uniref:pentatricopeptide repeat-containing protein At4g32450, mitochondrial-like n=1 Tax=Solanum dulcamara TaxID=45834 RepID=UPI0024855F5C|nr:pentatricopeptide repeat-containing protein At4g32450, mitochondrial-like [Solanum dulcamara]XP_055810070.1 pentatricopeptide repeat-containing protein At4g32450, mitochondrial-like [Solanum dulcamara]